MRSLSCLLFSLSLFASISSRTASAQSSMLNEDPAPPAVIELVPAQAPTPQTFDRLTFHRAPKPLNTAAKTSDWTRFLGPNDDARSPETHLLRDWPAEGPAKVWEVAKGDGYTSPAILGERLILFHSMEGRETIECLHAETGQRFWSYDYSAGYQDRFGYANGPRGSPVIAEGCVVTVGVTSIMTCLELSTGRLIWQRDLRTEFDVPQDFFGHGGSPLVMGDKVIVNVGGRSPRLSVGAFELKTGKLAWGALDEWGASYASPVPALLHGQEKVLVFAGGESDPATGGLMCLDAKSGTLHDRFPWRADDYISVNATSPVVLPGTNRAFVTTAYPKGRPLGGAMVEFGPDFKAREVWRSKKFAVHWMNPIYKDGHLYGIDGETDRTAKLVCYEAESGQEKWRKDLSWDDMEMSPGRVMKLSIQRASLLEVDGRFLCLGELGTLLWLDLNPAEGKVLARSQLFYAPHTWCLPAVSRGLLYVTQNYKEQAGGEAGQRILCYDLREP